VLFNADAAKAYGLEADAEWRPIANLTLTAGLSLLHSEIDDKRVYAQVCALNSVVVCTVKNPTIAIAGPFGTSTYAQIDGQPLPNAPKYNFSFTGRYDVPVGADGKLFVATDWNVQGYTNFVLYDTDEFYSKNNFEGGLKLGYEGKTVAMKWLCSAATSPTRRTSRASSRTTWPPSTTSRASWASRSAPS
jgi:iron complex outermembrane receptor protein